MKRWTWILLIIVLAVGLFVWRAFSVSIDSRPDQPATAEMVARGEYLATASDCVACHTAPGGEPFAGGLEFDLGDMGRLYSPNITPDQDTGIGGWSDDDFRRALHLGVGKGGKRLYPAFPYASYTLMSDEDVLAIKAYLFSLTPVKNTPPAAEMAFPYNQRALMAFWGLLFNPNERLEADPNQSEEWNRGRYLVEGPGHCGECHTPRNVLQARSGTKAYAGALTQGWRAYNISSDPDYGIGGWSEEALASYLSTGYAEGHGAASGPMAEAIDKSLRHLTQEDIRAMVVYLRTLDPEKSDVVRPVTQTVAAAASAEGEESSLGERVFVGACANCHRLDGKGAQTHYEALAGLKSVVDPQGINMMHVILNGSKLETPYGLIEMPSFARGYTDTEIAAVVNFVTGHFGGASAGVTAADVAQHRASGTHGLTVADASH